MSSTGNLGRAVEGSEAADKRGLPEWREGCCVQTSPSRARYALSVAIRLLLRWPSRRRVRLLSRPEASAVSA
eukprot:2772111-Pleurochrysis_carterae.AAC.1